MSTEPSGAFASWLTSLFQTKTQSGSLLLWMLRGCFGVIIIGAATYALTNLRSERESAYAILAFFSILQSPRGSSIDPRLRPGRYLQRINCRPAALEQTH